jgi:hypothetical protein
MHTGSLSCCSVDQAKMVHEPPPTWRKPSQRPSSSLLHVVGDGSGRVRVLPLWHCYWRRYGTRVMLANLHPGGMGRRNYLPEVNCGPTAPAAVATRSPCLHSDHACVSLTPPLAGRITATAQLFSLSLNDVADQVFPIIRTDLGEF